MEKMKRYQVIRKQIIRSRNEQGRVTQNPTIYTRTKGRDLTELPGPSG